MIFDCVSRENLTEGDDEFQDDPTLDVLSSFAHWDDGSSGTAQFSREVMCFALVEVHGAGTEVEPVLALTDEDMAIFLQNGEPTDGLWHLRLRNFNDGQVVDTAAEGEGVTQNAEQILESSARNLPLHKRHMLASEYLRSTAVRAFIRDRQPSYPYLIGLTTRLVKRTAKWLDPLEMSLG